MRIICGYIIKSCYKLKDNKQIILKVIQVAERKRLTTKEKYPHGAEGISEDKLTGRYCRGVFEATACVEKLAEYENAEEDGRLHIIPQETKYDINFIKHGHWKYLSECVNEGVYCSVCNKKIYKKEYANQKIKSKYCPNCGAIMDEDFEML